MLDLEERIHSPFLETQWVQKHHRRWNLLMHILLLIILTMLMLLRRKWLLRGILPMVFDVVQWKWRPQ